MGPLLYRVLVIDDTLIVLSYQAIFATASKSDSLGTESSVKLFLFFSIRTIPYIKICLFIMLWHILLNTPATPYIRLTCSECWWNLKCREACSLPFKYLGQEIPYPSNFSAGNKKLTSMFIQCEDVVVAHDYAPIKVDWPPS